MTEKYRLTAKEGERSDGFVKQKQTLYKRSGRSSLKKAKRDT